MFPRPHKAARRSSEPLRRAIAVFRFASLGPAREWVLLREAWLVGLGAVGVLLVVPQTAERYLPVPAAAPLAVFATGAVLVGCAVWLVRRRAHSR